VSSSGPDDKHAWLQVGAAALKHCVASGCSPEATLLLEAIRGARKRAVEYPRWEPINTSFRLGSGPVEHALIGAGMLIVAAGDRGLPMDYDELERWTRVGYERGMRSRKGER
jgi:hypothetical protein